MDNPRQGAAIQSTEIGSGEEMRPFRYAIGVAAMLLSTSVALASGTVRVQQVNGSVQTYPNSTFVVEGKTLRLTTADKKGTLVITDAACSFDGKLMRCLPYNVILKQGGSYQIPLRSGTIYYNPTGQVQTLSYSSSQIGPKGVLGTMHTVHGTYVTITGTLDGGAQR